MHCLRSRAQKLALLDKEERMLFIANARLEEGMDDKDEKYDKNVKISSGALLKEMPKNANSGRLAAEFRNNMDR